MALAQLMCNMIVDQGFFLRSTFDSIFLRTPLDHVWYMDDNNDLGLDCNFVLDLLNHTRSFHLLLHTLSIKYLINYESLTSIEIGL